LLLHLQQVLLVVAAVQEVKKLMDLQERLIPAGEEAALAQGQAQLEPAVTEALE
jgi:hypothetical protein